MIVTKINHTKFGSLPFEIFIVYALQQQRKLTTVLIDKFLEIAL